MSLDDLIQRLRVEHVNCRSDKKSGGSSMVSKMHAIETFGNGKRKRFDYSKGGINSKMFKA